MSKILFLVPERSVLAQLLQERLTNTIRLWFTCWYYYTDIFTSAFSLAISVS